MNKRYSAKVDRMPVESIRAKISELEVRALKEFKDMSRRGGSHAAAAVFANTKSTLQSYREALADKEI